jgi:hypothetical protein
MQHTICIYNLGWFVRAAELTPSGLADASQHGKVGASVRPRICCPLDV